MKAKTFQVAFSLHAEIGRVERLAAALAKRRVRLSWEVPTGSVGLSSNEAVPIPPDLLSDFAAMTESHLKQLHADFDALSDDNAAETDEPSAA